MADLIERLRTRSICLDGYPCPHDQKCVDAADEIKRLQAEVERLREDARRYRWVRKTVCINRLVYPLFHLLRLEASSYWADRADLRLYEAIDKALKNKRPQA